MRRNTGFTAIELMVVIAIAAILAALALPSFSHTIRKWQMKQAENGLVDAIYVARSEAVKWGGSVQLAKIPNAETKCTTTQQEWECGWRVRLTQSPLPAGITDPVIKLVRANGKIRVMTTNLTTLNLNRWGNPTAGFSLNLKHKTDSSLERCLNLSSGGRVQVVDGSCP